MSDRNALVPIISFTGEHAFLSNFAPSAIRYDGYVWPTAEHLFQAMKCAGNDHRNRTWVRTAPTAKEAKRRGRSVAMVGNWEQIKRTEMLRIVLAKFTQNPGLAERLDATWGRKLVEGNTWGDIYWGAVGEGQRGWPGHRDLGFRIWHDQDGGMLIGHNWLGRILTWVREGLHEEAD